MNHWSTLVALSYTFRVMSLAALESERKFPPGQTLGIKEGSVGRMVVNVG